MKVVNKGKGKQKWSKRVVCPECNAVLDIEKEDLYVINTAVAYAGETWEPELCFNCGSCESRVTVTNQVPSGIQWDLFDKARQQANSE